MKLHRNPAQSLETLEAFYQHLGYFADPDSGEVCFLPDYHSCGEMMLRLLHALTLSPDGFELQATTSHAALILTPPHPSSQPKRICISAWAGQYEIAFPFFSTDPAWQDAEVLGTTPDVHQATQMTLQAWRLAPTARDWALSVPQVPRGGIPSSLTNAVPLQRISAQQPETLHSYYEQLEPIRLWGFEGLAAQMRAFIHALEATGVMDKLWVYTSDVWRTALIVTNQDGENPGITIRPYWSQGGGFFTIAYPVPQQLVAWPTGSIRGTAKTVDQAVAMTIRALRQTFDTGKDSESSSSG